MSGKIITPQGAVSPDLPPEFTVNVLVNGSPTPYPLAVLAVQSDQAASLSRIAEVLEFWRDQQPAYASIRADELKAVSNVVPIRGPRPDDGTGAPLGDNVG